MKPFFHPKGVAVIGATRKLKGGLAIVANLLAAFKGGIYPVNPQYEDIQDAKCYPSVLDVPDPVDLAIVFIPNTFVPGVLLECAQRGIRHVMIQSAGFAETGPDGKDLQDRIMEIARDNGMRLWGPNCLGMVDAVNRHVFSFVSPTIWHEGPIPGDVSLVVQSGMLAGGFLIDTMSHGTMGISKVCSIGNKADVNECDLLEYLINDPDTGGIGLYLEAIPQGRRFADLCRSSQKPIVVLKGGRSARGAEAAMSHTASLAGDDAVIRGALAQAGVAEARDFKQMLDICRALAITRDLPVKGPGRTAILTYSGGAGIISADFFDDVGLETARLSPDTLAALETVYPDWMPPANPIDLWPAIEKHGGPKVFETAVRAVCQDPGVDALFLHLFVGGVAMRLDMEEIARITREAGKPLFIWLIGGKEDAREFHLKAQELGVPVFREVFRAVECMAAVFERANNHKPNISPVLARPENSRAMASLVRELTDDAAGVLDEFVSKKILAAAMVPVVAEDMAPSLDKALESAGRLGYPVVMKGLAPGLAHKTEAGLVQLDITSDRQVESAYSALMAAMDGKGSVLVQKQVPKGVELIAGFLRDPQFGPCVMVGLGGVYAEILKDRAFALAPLGHDDARALIGRLKNQELLSGFRGAPPVDTDALARIIVALGNLGKANDAIREIDINPLIAGNREIIAVDATVIV